MEFIDRFSDAHRERLLEAGRDKRLRKGRYLMRQGERGGDIFLVEQGALEVVDSSSSPEVVLSVLRPGTVVGEMAFLDASPRAADVRAATDACCRLWDHGELSRILAEEPEFGAAFYRAIAETTVDRIRKVQATAVAGGLGPPPKATARVADDMAREAHRISSAVQHRWMKAEGRLRRNTSDAAAPIEIARAFGDLVRKTRDWLDSLRTASEQQVAGEALAAEMRPYLLRSALAELALDPPSRHSGDPRLMAHVLLGGPAGDGLFGEILDRSLLEMPTCDALRERTATVTRAIKDALEASPQSDRPFEVAIVFASTGAILAGVVPALAARGARVTCIDGSRESLAFVDSGLTTRPRSVELRLVQDDLSVPSQALRSVEPGTADLLVLDGLVDYLPDRLVAGVLAQVGERLAPGGTAYVTGVAESLDAPIFDWLLGWPMVRRSPRVLRALVEAADLQAEVVDPPQGGSAPGVVVKGTRPVSAQSEQVAGD